MTTSKWFSVTLTLLVSACHNPGAFSMSSEVEAPAISIKERPHPQKAYQILLTIENAPGPFGMVEGSAQYDVTNLQECGEINSNTGMAYRINTSPPIRWQRLSDTEYVAKIHSDLMIDEDYYGRGMCHWAFTQARAQLKATGAHEETDFVPAISDEQIAAGQPVTWYFPKIRYPVSGIADFVEFGERDPSGYKPEIRNQLFTITLTPVEVQP